jgi:phosphoglycerate dehydrogenase-like enzyme
VGADGAGRVKVVALDDYQDAVRGCGPWDQLADRIDLEVVTEYIGDRDALAARLADAEVAVAMRERTRFDAELLDRLPALRLLVTKGMWNAAIDLDAATRNGVTVCGTRNVSDPTAELTWALILALRKNLLVETAAMREGRWQQTLGGELRGATLGVIGLGNLGSKVAAVGLAFGMDVVAWSQNLTAGRAAEVGVEAVSKPELLSRADIVTLHLKLSDRSRGTIGADELAAMKPDALLVNTSRGPLIDTDALLRALHDGTIGGAGLDVYDEEPLPADHPLRSAPNTVLTPHVGYVTREGYEAHFRQVVEGIGAWLDGTPVRVLDARD